jgi:hypothetical protein
MVNNATTTMNSVEIDLCQFLVESAPAHAAKQKDALLLRAHGLVQWLLSYHFPAKLRKSIIPISVSSPHRGKICIRCIDTDNAKASCGSDCDFDGPKWEKNAFQVLKKIRVDDLGHMHATELRSSIPSNDSEGRGMADMNALEKKLCVKVVFDSETDHVILVGDERKLEKKVFDIRNMLSHYHWRLSGNDVTFDKATSS